MSTLIKLAVESRDSERVVVSEPSVQLDSLGRPIPPDPFITLTLIPAQAAKDSGDDALRLDYTVVVGYFPRGGKKKGSCVLTTIQTEPFLVTESTKEIDTLLASVRILLDEYDDLRDSRNELELDLSTETEDDGTD